MSYIGRIEERLAQIAAQHRTRELQAYQVENVIDFASNDYLGLAADPRVVEALKRARRVGSGGARLLGGRHREHSLLEEELAAWLGRERALLFSSGYLAAIGAVTALAPVVDAIASDALTHASFIDGIRLTKVARTIYPHGALPGRERRPAATMVVSETLFGMDGDRVEPAALLAQLGPDDVLLLDEAHALGVFGREGAGLAHGLDDPRIVVFGTLSKALGGLGGFVAGPARVIELLISTARTFIFDTALPPQLALAARVALAIARQADESRSRLVRASQLMRSGLREVGAVTCGDERSPIVPILLGTETHALNLSRALLEKRIYAPAVRPPTVPPGASRLRLAVRADHTDEHLDIFLRELQRCIATS